MQGLPLKHKRQRGRQAKRSLSEVREVEATSYVVQTLYLEGKHGANEIARKLNIAKKAPFTGISKTEELIFLLRKEDKFNCRCSKIKKPPRLIYEVKEAEKVIKTISMGSHYE